jgi:GT2 family glycosyltransferase
MEDLAPPVVAVIVTSDPGPWFEETLRSFAEQDYPELSVLVLDAGSVEDPTPRVAAELPDAFVRRLPENRGFAASVDAVIGMVSGASHLLLCHDDVVLDPDVVHTLVEEAFRSNAGVVGPKLVAWDDPEQLLHVGMAVDKSGAVVDRVEPGEIDHGQHDGVRDVFLVPGGCLLVRADLFGELGGFDPSITAMGEDLDLCWRAQVAGARVVVAPTARVRHLELLARGSRRLPPGEPGIQALQRRHELRVALTTYSRVHLLRVLPQMLALSLAEIVVALGSGQRARAGAVLRAWTWNLHGRDLRAARRAVRARRRLADRDVRRLQVHGSARLTRYLRRIYTEGFRVGRLDAPAQLRPGQPVAPPTADGGPDEDVLENAPLGDRAPVDGPATGVQVDGAGAAEQTGRGSGRLITWLVVALVLVVGTRQLFGGALPWVGQLLALPHWQELFHRFSSGWRQPGLGGNDPTSPATAVLGVAALLLGGSSALAVKILVLGCIPVGAVGVFRLVRPFGSPKARMAAALSYLAVPVAYDALATGRLDGLIAFAAAPWIVGRLARASEIAPLGSARAPAPGSWTRRRRSLAGQVVGLGFLEAAVCAIAPAGAVLTFVLALTMGVGAVVALGREGLRPAARMAVLAVGATVVSGILLAPWAVMLLAGPARWQAVTGLGLAAGAGPTWPQLLRLAVGPIGDTPLAYGIVAAAALPLVIGTRRRLTWAVVGWTVVVGAWLTTWAEGRAWLGGLAVDPQVLLAAAAVGVALCIGLGVAAFERDLAAYRFGWRQAVAALAAAASVVGALPVLAAAGGGRWDVVPTGYGEATAWLAAKAPPGGFRVLWLGDPRALPGGGWQLERGVGFSVTDGGLPDMTGIWPGADPGPAAAVGRAVRSAEGRGTVELGHVLAGAGIHYVVVVEGLAPEIPGFQSAPSYGPPARLTAALGSQLDLEQVPGQGGLDVYVNMVPATGKVTGHATGPWWYRAAVAAEVVLWIACLAAYLERRLGLDRRARRRRRRMRALPRPPVGLGAATRAGEASSQRAPAGAAR